LNSNPNIDVPRPVPYSCSTRLARIDFPRFNGDNVDQWIYQCENFLLIDHTPEDVHVQLAIMQHPEGRERKVW